MSVDPFAMPAEIAAILSAAEAIPHVHRRASRKERREAYLAYQRESYRLMSAINHLSFLVQVESITWRDSAAMALPMVAPLVESLIPAEPSKHRFIRNMQEFGRLFVDMVKAGPPSTTAVTVARTSDIQLRDRAIADIAAVRDIIAEFLAALAEVRLVGRPAPVAAVDVIRALTQELIEAIPKHKVYPFNLRPPGSKRKESDQRQEFSKCLNALGAAHSQFLVAMRDDRVERRHTWQLWRPSVYRTRSAQELLEEARQPNTDNTQVAQR